MDLSSLVAIAAQNSKKLATHLGCPGVFEEVQKMAVAIRTEKSKNAHIRRLREAGGH